jgi:glutaredoxin
LRYIDEAGNINFVEKLSEVPEKYRDQIVAPPPPPYSNQKEYRAWKKMQVRIAKEQAKRIEMERRAELKRSTQRGGKAGNQSSDATEIFKQVENVEVFVSPTCRDCQKLEAFLKQNKIKYKKLDIVKSQQAFEKFDLLAAGSALPVTKIGNKVISGLALEAILEAATKFRKNPSSQPTEASAIGKL